MVIVGRAALHIRRVFFFIGVSLLPLLEETLLDRALSLYDLDEKMLGGGEKESVLLLDLPRRGNDGR